MITSSLLWLYKLTLYAFPAGFRADFAEEMVGVFQELLAQQARQGVRALWALGWREFRQLPLALWRAHRAMWRKSGIGRTLLDLFSRSPFHPVPPANDGRSSWWQTLLEIAPFVVSAIFLYVLVYQRPDWLPAGRQLPWPVMSWFVLLFALPLFLLGLVHALPRWAYPAAGLLLGYSLLLAQSLRVASFWVTMLVAAYLLALAAVYTHLQSQPLPPFLRRIGRSMELDWTRLAFGLYGVMPWVILLAFDGVFRMSHTPYLALSLVLLVVGALAYSRSGRQPRQFAVLLAAVTLTPLPAVLHQATFHGGLLRWLLAPLRWPADAGWIGALWSFMLALLLLPVLARLACLAWTAESVTSTAGEPL